MNSSDCFAKKEHVPGVYRVLTIHSHLLVIFGLATSLLTAFIITSNVMLVVVLIYSRFHSNNTRGKRVRITSSNVSRNTSLLMTSLVVCNIVQGVVSMPMAVSEIITNGQWALGPQACTIRDVSDVIVGCASIYHVICMATDMYIAVCKPLKYRLLPAKIGYCMIGACWMTPCALILPPILLELHSDGLECLSFENACNNMFDKQFFLFGMTISLLIPFLAISTMYVLIVRTIVLYHKRKPNNFYPAKDTKLPKELFQCPRNETLPEGEAESDRVKEIFSVDEMKGVFIQQNFKNHNDIITSDFQLTTEEIALENFYFAETNVKEMIEMTTELHDEKSTSVDNHIRNQIGMTLMSLRKHNSNLNLIIANDCCSEVAVDCVSSPTRIISPESGIGKSLMLSCIPADFATRRTKSLHVTPTFYFKPTTSRLPSTSMDSYKRTYSKSQETPLNSSLVSSNGTPSKSPEITLNSTKKRTSPSPRRNVKAFRNIGCIMACFSLCWFPFCICLIVFVYNPIEQPAWSLQAIAWLGYLSTAVSPVVLCGNKHVRAAIKALLDSLSRSRPV